MRMLLSLFALLFLALPAAAQDRKEVDMALAMAIDISGSIDPDEARLQRLDSSTVTVIRQNKFIGLRVPLAALDYPDRILTSARTSMAEVPFDWVAWRILVLPAKPAARNP